MIRCSRDSNRFRRLLFAAILSSPLVASMALAADFSGAIVPAYDDDFVLQGEYVGNVRTASGISQTSGLQVVARGKGDFIAVEYVGGLPGNGGIVEGRRKYTGKTDGSVELTGDDRRITIEENWATIRDGAGRDLGRLRKYHRLSLSLRVPPPSGATVLFGGSGTDQLTKGTTTADHLLNVGADTTQSFGDFTMHVEFRTPYMPTVRGQQRGNSGVYIQGRYELQILDSFGLDGLNNECGGIYTRQPPLINMCFPPLSWQTYDIDFTAARFDAEGKKTADARITARHNGILIHNEFAIPGKTGAGAAEGPDPRPIRFQDHNDRVHFRNIWIMDRKPGSGWRPGRDSADPCLPCPDLASGTSTDGLWTTRSRFEPFAAR